MQPPELYALIESQELDVAEMTPADIAAHINTTVNKTPDHVPKTSVTIIRQFGLDTAGLILGTLQAAGQQNPVVKSALARLDSSTGLDFSDPLMRQMIPVLAEQGEWPAEITAAVLALGEITTPVNPGEDVTADEVTAALQYRVNSQRLVKNYNAAHSAAEAGADWDAIESLLTAGE